MTPPPEPRTAAGRAHLKDGSATANTDARRKAILAIEAEKDGEYEQVVDLYRQQREEARDEAEAAGAPLREALERLVRLDGVCWTLESEQAMEQARAALTATPAPAPLDEATCGHDSIAADCPICAVYDRATATEDTHQHDFVNPANEVIQDNGYLVCRICGKLQEPQP